MASGFIHQNLDPETYEACGSLSVVHAALVVGYPMEWRATGIDDGGCHLKPLMRHARGKGLLVRDVSRATISGLRTAVDAELAARRPVVIGSNYDPHWCVLIGKSGRNQYVCVDSAEADIFVAEAWSWYADWLTGDGPWYKLEAFSLASPDDRRGKHSMVPHAAGIWELLANDHDFAEDWGNCLEEVQSLFDYEPSSSMVPAKTFFENNEEPIIQAVEWHGTEESVARCLYERWSIVADFHDYQLPEAYESAAMVDAALLLATKAEDYE